MIEKESKEFQYKEPGGIPPDAVKEGMSATYGCVERAHGWLVMWTTFRAGIFAFGSLVSSAVVMIKIQRVIVGFLFN